MSAFCHCFEVIPPAVYLRVTENVHHIVTFIEGIIKNGHAYATKEGEYLGTPGCCFSHEMMSVSLQYPSQHLWNAFVAGDVYFDIQSIGNRYGKFVGAVDSQGEPGKCFCLSVWHLVILEDRSVSLQKIIWWLTGHLIDR